MINYIVVTYIKYSKAILEYELNNKKIRIDVFVGRNGVTHSKIEGDGKTPLGKFYFGKILGMHNKNEIDINNYIEINKNLYWVDDINSNYYNNLVDISKIKKDWNSAEHLIDNPKEYEYLIEIKTNPNNIPNKGSAIFLHCSNNKPTSGCISIDKKYLLEILKNINNKTIIEIKKLKEQ